MNYFISSTFFKVAGLSIIIFIVLDIVWLSAVARSIYFKHMGYLGVIENGQMVFNLPVGLTVQAIMAFGMVVFISLGLLTENTLTTSVVIGGFAGFVMYCTYDLTNLSFVRGYPVFITVVDIAWGTAQGIFAGLYVFYLTRYFSS